MKIFVLSLAHANERRKYISEHLNSNGVDFEFFNALGPTDLDLSVFEKSLGFLSKEAVATFESHRKIIQKVKEIDDFVLILEDDATIIKSDVIQKIEHLLSIKNDFDILFLGYKTRNTLNERDKPIDIDANFQKINNFFELHAYIVNPKKVDRIISALGKPNMHVDIRISDLIWENKIDGIFTKEKLFEQNKSFQTQIPKGKKIQSNMNSNKIFQIGFNRCGTTSIHQFFLDNGLKSIHWDRGNLARRIKMNSLAKLPLLKGYEEYECFTDMESPITGDFAYIEHYKELDRQYPGSKFILNLRDIEDWIKSRLNHGEGRYINIYKRNENLTNDEDVISHWRDIWHKHIEDVKNYFKDRPDDLLVFDIKDESDKFVEFMSKFKNIRYKVFGKYNETKENK